MAKVDREMHVPPTTRTKRASSLTLDILPTPLIFERILTQFAADICEVTKKKPPSREAFENRITASGSFNDFAGFQAVGAYAQPLGCAFHHGAYRAQVHVPAPLAHVVGVADLISELRSLD